MQSNHVEYISHAVQERSRLDDNNGLTDIFGFQIGVSLTGALTLSPGCRRKALIGSHVLLQQLLPNCYKYVIVTVFFAVRCEQFQI